MKPEYSDHLVAFYDLLGFGDFVRNQGDAAEVQRVFERITDLSSVKGNPDYFGTRVVRLSDTVIRTTAFTVANDQPHRYLLLERELLDLINFQIELIWNELLWLRGSITYGLVYHDERAAFGPGIVRGYEMERNVAFFPRVIIDPKLLNHLDETNTLATDHHDYDTGRRRCFEFLRRGDDGMWFLDYLRAARHELGDDPKVFPTYLQRHKRMVLRGLAFARSDMDRLTQKYSWLVTYHNRTIHEIDASFWDWIDFDPLPLRITAEEFPLCYTILCPLKKDGMWTWSPVYPGEVSD